MQSPAPPPTAFSAGAAIQEVLVFALLAVLTLAVSELAAALWRPLGVVLYACLLLIVLFAVLGINHPRNSDTRLEYDAAFAVVGAVASVIAFGQLSRHLYLLFAAFNGVRQVDYQAWLALGINNILDGLLFDLPSAFAWKLTNIEPATWWSRALVFAYVKSMNLFVIKTVLAETALVRKA